MNDGKPFALMVGIAVADAASAAMPRAMLDLILEAVVSLTYFEASSDTVRKSRVINSGKIEIICNAKRLLKVNKLQTRMYGATNELNGRQDLSPCADYKMVGANGFSSCDNE